MQKSQAEIEALEREAEIAARREAERKAKEEAEWLEEMKRDAGLVEGYTYDAGWVEGYTYEEEEEPDFWEFIRQLGRETDERIRRSMEQEENYFVARFDFH